MTRRLRFILTFVVALFCGPVQASTTGSILIENQRSDRIEIWIDRQSVGDVRGETERVFYVSTGRHHVEVRDRNGDSLRQARVTSTPRRQARLTIEGVFGHLVIPNPHDIDVELRIDGRDVGEIEAGSSRAFRLEAGSHRIESSYRLAGRSLQLDSRTIRLSADERRRITLERPSTGLVRVENRLGRTAVLHVDGERLQMMDDGESQIIELPLGSTRLGFRVRQRSLVTQTVTVRPFEIDRFVGEFPTGELRVRNPLPVGVRLLLDGSSSVWLSSGQSHVFDEIAVGTVRLRVEARDGTEIHEQSVEIRPDSRRSVRIPERTRGLVIVDSRVDRPLDVFVDARRIDTVDSSGRLEMSLEPGMHRIQVRDPAGRLLWSREVEVDPYETISLPVTSGYVANNDGTGWHIRPGRND